MRSPGGSLIITDPGSNDARAKVVEHDTFTCIHCNDVVVVPHAPAPMPGGLCHRCMAPICDKCTDAGVCTPFEEKLKRWESRDRLLKAVG